MATPDPGPGYRDILLIGKTGQGKSTTGNKLLGLQLSETDTPEALQRYVYEQAPILIHGQSKTDTPQPATEEGRTEAGLDESAGVEREQLYFVQAKADECESKTTECKILSNERTRVRVLDTPGFADTKRAAKLGLYSANLQTIRWIVRQQEENNLSFYRVLYFLPSRGPLERGDRGVQEEIKVMAHFFGDSIFHRMVIIATLSRRFSEMGLELDENEIEQTRKAFTHAMRAVLEETGIESDAKCPPIAFISVKDKGEDILKKVDEADVEAKTWPVHQDPGINFRSDVCAKCAASILTLDDGRKWVKYEDKDPILYSDSTCHPLMVPKYSPAKKFFGGLGHISTAGIPYLVIDVIKKKRSWPGWFNSDEICPACCGPAGALGCASVQKDCEVELKDIKKVYPVEHSNKL